MSEVKGLGMTDDLRSMSFIAKHKWAILVAVLVGIIMGLPHSYFVWKNSDSYQGLFLGGLDEVFYMSRIQEIRDGHLGTGNAVWAEGKDLPYLRPPGSEIITFALGAVFGLNTVNSVLFGNFVFPFLVFLLIYFLVYQLIEKKSPALLAASLVMLTSNLTGPGALWNLLAKGQVENVFLFYTRLVSPQIHGLFFFAFFLFFIVFIKKRNWIFGFLSGLMLGGSFYVYPYTWTFIGAFLGCLGLIFLFRKNWAGIKNIILIGGLALLLAIPYFLNLLEAMNHPFYGELALRTGILNSHKIVIGGTVLILVVLFLFFFPRVNKKIFDFTFALVLAPLVVLNQQILTGKLLTSAHYHYYYHKPLLIIFLVVVVFYQLKKYLKNDRLFRAIWSFLFIAGLAISFYNAWLVQSGSYQAREKVALAEQRYGLVFQWLNKNAQKDEVVMANFDISELIPVYTSLNAVSAMDGHYYLGAEESRVLERMFLPYRLDGLASDKAESFFFENREDISKKVFGQRYRKSEGGYGEIPDASLIEFADAYKEFLTAPIEDVLKKYQARYLVWDSKEQPSWPADEFDFLELAFEQNSIKIYKIQY